MGNRIAADIPNFTWEEIRCKGTGLVLITDRLFAHMRLLQKLRELVGPITITSGYRSESYNTQVGGAPASQHLTIATDIIPRAYSLDATAELADQLGFTGIGRYDSFLHLDTRSGSIAEWDNRTS